MLVVVHDKGAASPMEIRAGLGGLGEVVYALPPSPFNERYAPLLEEFGRVVPLDPGTALDTVRALRPDAVLTFSESRLRLTAALTEGLGLPGHTAATAEALTDKPLQRARLAEAGVDRVRNAPLDAGPGSWERAVAEVGLPAVLKPARGEGSRTTHRIDDPAPHPEAGDGMVLEEFLTGRDNGPHGDYVSVESVVTGGRAVHFAITGKHPLLPPFRERGDFWPAVLEPGEDTRLRELTGAALAALGVRTGVTHTEVKLTPDGPRIIEVNGRPAGFLNGFSTRAAGLDVVRLAGRAALGADLAPAPVTVDGVCFQYLVPAPDVACRLVSVRGAKELRAVPGVTGHRRLLPPRGLVEAGVMTTPLDVVQGRATDHAAMAGVLEEALGRLRYEFETGEGRFTATAADLAEGHVVGLPQRE